MDTIKKEVLEALEKHLGIVTIACRSVNLPRSTFYSWKQTDPEFSKAVDELVDVALDHVESKLFEKINGVQVGKYNSEGELIVYDQPPSDTAIIFFLKTKGKRRGYVEKYQVEDTTEADHSEVLSKMSIEDLDALRKIRDRMSEIREQQGL